MLSWFIIPSSSLAQEIEAQAQLVPTHAAHADWAFSGLVSTEAGDLYGFFFQLERANQHYKVHAYLYDEQTGKELFREAAEAVIQEQDDFNWKIGRAFLRFKPITQSWILGVQTKEKRGFNFKVDMLSPSDKKPEAKMLRSGIEEIVRQTSRVNGHIELNESTPNVFVTAKHAWFQQVWLTETQEKKHPFLSLMCRFDDGSGFYSVNMRESDAKHGAITGAYDAKGKPKVISQFINIKQSEPLKWQIKLASPALALEFADLAGENNVYHAGFVNFQQKRGFCTLLLEELGGNRA